MPSTSDTVGELTREFLPQAILGRPPAFFKEQGIVFREDSDDLDYYEVAELHLENALPYALLRYRGMPADQTTVYLPNSLRVKEIPRVMRKILRAFHLPRDAVLWLRGQHESQF
jgi:hypothetical protein